jgi:hypothetical protein
MKQSALFHLANELLLVGIFFITMAKEIKLTQGKFTIVDDDMYDYLNQWKWHVINTRGLFYAAKCNSRIRGTKIKMHKLLTNNLSSDMVTDHINGNTLDNRKCNLRVCTRSQNQMNRGATVKNKTGYKGVYYHENRNAYKVQIKVNNKTYYLGYFTTPKKAAAAYNQAAVKYHGEFAKLNEI